MAAYSQIQDVKVRLAAWVLISDSRSGLVGLILTHAHLAEMLGVRRASVTEAAMQLKTMGMLDYQRGRVRILDRPQLGKVASWAPERKGVRLPLSALAG